jgi:hypothetical protein
MRVRVDKNRRHQQSKIAPIERTSQMHARYRAAIGSLVAVYEDSRDPSNPGSAGQALPH